MRVETEKQGVSRDVHSKGLTMRKDEKYEAYLNRKKANKRIDMLEEKMDKILRLLEDK